MDVSGPPVPLFGGRLAVLNEGPRPAKLVDRRDTIEFTMAVEFSEAERRMGSNVRIAIED